MGKWAGFVNPTQMKIFCLQS